MNVWYNSFTFYVLNNISVVIFIFFVHFYTLICTSIVHFSISIGYIYVILVVHLVFKAGTFSKCYIKHLRLIFTTNRYCIKKLYHLPNIHQICTFLDGITTFVCRT